MFIQHHSILFLYISLAEDPGISRESDRICSFNLQEAFIIFQKYLDYILFYSVMKAGCGWDGGYSPYYVNNIENIIYENVS